jgi:hypothetical protein
MRIARWLRMRIARWRRMRIAHAARNCKTRAGRGISAFCIINSALN